MILIPICMVISSDITKENYNFSNNINLLPSNASNQIPSPWQIANNESDVISIQRSLANSTISSIINDSSIISPSGGSDVVLHYDPPNHYSSPTALGLFLRSNYMTAKIYYDENGGDPTTSSPYVVYSAPYLQLITPFKHNRFRNITIVAVVDDTSDTGNIYRSEQYYLSYAVEAGSRPNSYGFLVPGIESNGFFIRFGIEIQGSARAQAAGSQEFADFTSNLGRGTYSSQIQALSLTSLDSDLQGFEGGFPVNTSDGKHYGILIPYHNGERFFGKLVRVNLKDMGNITYCLGRYAMESYNSSGHLIKTGGNYSATDACVYVLDLETISPRASGFRKGFFEYPYGYLAAGEFDILVRVNIEKFGLEYVKLIDLSQVDSTYGGYSGGFVDGSWACFSPYRTFYGSVGGIRSSLIVDQYQLRPYFYAAVLCVNHSAWTTSNTSSIKTDHSFTIDFSSIQSDLRGFSDAIRVGRYAYFSPLSSAEHVYSSKLVRISLGDTNIGSHLSSLQSSGVSVRTIIDILDLSKKSSTLAGYSGMFTSGQYLILVPFRNAYEPTNGQRGHGVLTRLNMNDFSLKGIDYIDLTVTTRNQIPSFPDFELKGFSGGFASGQYGFVVPFFNGKFNGKIARFLAADTTLATNVQELDLSVDRTRINTYLGFRGGFVSLWQGVAF
eukprot:gene7496-10213_t